MDAFPTAATWRHLEPRQGLETLFATRSAAGWRLEGWTAALEGGRAWLMRYTIAIDDQGRTHEARVECRSEAGAEALLLEGDGRGAWTVDSAPAPHLNGCLDVDLEAAASTNALPLRRLELKVGGRAEAPAAWVRAPRLGVERLEQSYARLPDEDGRERYDYAAPSVDFAAVVAVDGHGLPLDYLGIAVRTS